MCIHAVINMYKVYIKMTDLVDEGRVVDVAHLHFSKSCDTVSHSIFLEKLVACSLDGWMIH